MSRFGWLCSFVSFLGVGCVQARVVDAPFFVQNEHPVQRSAIRQSPRDASVLPDGVRRVRGALAWTSHWLRDGNGRDSIRMDGETVWLDLEYSQGLGAGFEVELRASVGHASGGALDGFIEGWHEFFGLPQSQRDELPRDRFVMEATRIDEFGAPSDVYELGHDELLFGDLPIFLVWQAPLPSEVLDLSFRAGVELPTGSESRGAGNGAFDFLVGANVSLRLHERLTAHAWTGYSWVGNSDRAERAGTELAGFASFGSAISLRLSEELVAIAQLMGEQSVLRELSEERAEREQLLLWLGGRAALAPGVGLEFSVAEDLILQVSPDVQLHVGIVIE